jgi:hypothetical protein
MRWTWRSGPRSLFSARAEASDQACRRGEPENGEPLGKGRMRWPLKRLEREGSPRVQGVAGAVQVLLGHEAPEAFGERLGASVDAAGAPGCGGLRGRPAPRGSDDAPPLSLRL